jgi:hypothetical protein
MSKNESSLSSWLSYGASIYHNRGSYLKTLGNGLKAIDEYTTNYHQIGSADSIFNRNCHAYLHNICLKIPKELLVLLPRDISGYLVDKFPDYDPQFAYGDLYKTFFEALEPIIEKQYKVLESSLGSSWDEFIDVFFSNDNDCLNQTYKAIAPILNEKEVSYKKVKEDIATLISDDDNQSSNNFSPSYVNSPKARFIATTAGDYKPHHTTSLVSIRRYNHSSDLGFIEYRMGTQGQRHLDKARVNPLFEHWLEVQEKKYPSRKIIHLYINNLGLDRDDLEGLKEQELSLKLHELEKNHTQLAVITLPADKELMDVTMLTKRYFSPYSSIMNEFFLLASQDSKYRGVRDFYISPAIKQLLYKNQNESGTCTENEAIILKTLLSNSFKALGYDEQSVLNSAQKQAVWFHFVKFEFTNFLIETLKPRGVNFSCKDGVDRAGVASAYYHLIKSFSMGKPMTKDEFNTALQAAPAMVKGRGMNHHFKILWNVVNCYVDANKEALMANEKMNWLVSWRDDFSPSKQPSTNASYGFGFL